MATKKQIEQNRIDRAKFRDYLLRQWPHRDKHRATILFALMMLENEDNQTGEIRVSEAGLMKQHSCNRRNVYKHLREVKELGFYEICGTWWPESQKERRRTGRPATPCKIYRRRLPSEFSVDIDMSKKTPIPSKDIVPSIPSKEFSVENDTKLETDPFAETGPHDALPTAGSFSGPEKERVAAGVDIDTKLDDPFTKRPAVKKVDFHTEHIRRGSQLATNCATCARAQRASRTKAGMTENEPEWIARAIDYDEQYG